MEDQSFSLFPFIELIEAVNLDAPVILGGTFTWSNYPVLERVLKEHMKEYFEMR